jgi:hypothetical protein
LNRFYGGSARQHYPNYYVEYEVRFAVPENECLTGMVTGDAVEHFPLPGNRPNAQFELFVNGERLADALSAQSVGQNPA